MSTLTQNELEQNRPGRLSRFLARLLWKIGFRPSEGSAAYLRELQHQEHERTPEIPFLSEAIAGEERPLDYHLKGPR